MERASQGDVNAETVKDLRLALDHWTMITGHDHCVCSSLSFAASGALLPYSFSLLCKVFKLIPRISAARVLLLLVDSRVLRISIFSASPTVVPTPSRTASGSLAAVRIGAWPKPGGK